eukprot:402456-Amphidinium_carterae.1
MRQTVTNMQTVGDVVGKNSQGYPGLGCVLDIRCLAGVEGVSDTVGAKTSSAIIRSGSYQTCLLRIVSIQATAPKQHL